MAMGRWKGEQRRIRSTAPGAASSDPPGFAGGPAERPRGLAVVALFAVITALPALPLQAQEVLKPDHVTICGSRLDVLQQAFASVGLDADFGGIHANGSTQMAQIGFDDLSYIELLAPARDGAADKSPWSKQMVGDAGPCFWFVANGDIQAEAARLEAAGVPATRPQEGSRKRPDGRAVEWRSSVIGTDIPGTVYPVMIEDITPRPLRIRVSKSVKGAPVTGVAAIVIGVRDLSAAIADLRKAYGWPEPRTDVQPGFGRVAYFPRQPLLLAQAESGWVKERVAKFGDGPVAFMLAANNFDAARKKYKLSESAPWFGRRVGWFDPGRLNGIHLGVMGK